MNKKGIEQPDFMPEVEKLQEQIIALKDRIALVEQNKEKVRPKIYEKVRGDYETKLNELHEKLNPFKQKIEELILEITSAIDELNVEFEAYTEEMEELELRFLANEFSDDDFQPKQKEIESVRNDIQDKINAHQEAVDRYQKQLAFISGTSIEPEPSPAESGQPDAVESEETWEEEESVPSDHSSAGQIDQLDEPGDAFNELQSNELAEENGSVASSVMEEATELEESDEEEFTENLQSSNPPQITHTDLKTDDAVEDLVAAGTSQPAPEIAIPTDDDYIWQVTPVLDVIEGDFAGESYPMDKERITIGRGPNNDIQLATDTSVSRHHAQISYENTRYVIVDLESSNGTSVNGIRITRTYLRPNDEIMKCMCFFNV
jgi:hypothetical protein